MVLALLEAGADVHARTSSSETPLHFAAHANNTLALRWLCERGASVFNATNNGETCLARAVDSNCYDFARALLDFVSAREPAALAGFVNAKISKICSNHNLGETVLHDAAERGYQTMVALLLRHGARADAKRADGKTPRESSQVTTGTPIYRMLVAAEAKLQRAAENETLGRAVAAATAAPAVPSGAPGSGEPPRKRARIEDAAVFIDALVEAIAARTAAAAAATTDIQ
jgi:ankyrin repeat protein